MSALALCCVFVALIGMPAARAQGGAMDGWAIWALAPKVWKGQTVLAPDTTPRPSGDEFALRLDSERLPLHVHARAGFPVARAAQALLDLETAYDVLSLHGWPLPFADGGYGATTGFDLYLEPDAPAAAVARLDGVRVAWSDFDSVQTYAVVDAGLPRAALHACVLSAFAQAGLRGQDPSEAASVLRASGDFASWLLLGELGCDDSMARAQLAPGGATLDADPESAGAGALLLSMLSERHDAGSGEFVRAAWELTRQHSLGLVPSDRLRSSPDLWEVFAQALKLSAHEDLNDALEEFAAARFFSGAPQRKAAAPYRVLAALPAQASVPLLATLDWGASPKHVLQADGIGCLGSNYVQVATVGAKDGDQLRIWLRGELVPFWSLQALRLSASGKELGRVKSAVRRVPQSYLPLTLTADTAQVIVVVTYLPEHAPDADDYVPPPHGFELIVDRQLAN